MAKGSFYRYAADKEDVVAQILAPVIAEVIAALDRCEQRLRTGRRDDIAAIYLVLARELSQVVARHAPRVLLYLQEARAPQAAAPPAIRSWRTRSTSRTIALTEIARDHGLIRAVDPESRRSRCSARSTRSCSRSCASAARRSWHPAGDRRARRYRAARNQGLMRGTRDRRGTHHRTDPVDMPASCEPCFSSVTEFLWLADTPVVSGPSPESGRSSCCAFHATRRR